MFASPWCYFTAQIFANTRIHIQASTHTAEEQCFLKRGSYSFPCTLLFWYFAIFFTRMTIFVTERSGAGKREAFLNVFTYFICLFKFSKIQAISFISTAGALRKGAVREPTNLASNYIYALIAFEQ